MKYRQVMVLILWKQIILPSMHEQSHVLSTRIYMFPIYLTKYLQQRAMCTISTFAAQKMSILYAYLIVLRIFFSDKMKNNTLKSKPCSVFYRSHDFKRLFRSLEQNTYVEFQIILCCNPSIYSFCCDLSVLSQILTWYCTCLQNGMHLHKICSHFGIPDSYQLISHYHVLPLKYKKKKEKSQSPTYASCIDLNRCDFHLFGPKKIV